jgi:hypothetical protein
MGWVKAVTPAVLGIAKRSPRAGNLAYRAIQGISKGQQVAGPAVKSFASKAGKSLPYVGAGVTAIAATGSYQDAVNRGENPGKVAFRGIGETAGGFIGGAVGSGAGPIGTVGGYFGGSMAGGAAADAAWNAMTGGDSSDKPVNYNMTVDEQRERRRQLRAQGRLATRAGQDGMIDIAGFRYTPGVDNALVMGRMQQQFQNINAVQGYSRDKHMINAQLKGTLGQQATDRYMYGQMYGTDRHNNLQNNITSRREIDAIKSVSLGQQYTQRFGKQLDAGNERYRDTTSRIHGTQDRDNNRYGLETTRRGQDQNYQLNMYDLQQGYGLKERERKDKRYKSELDYRSSMRNSDNLRDVGMYQAIGGLFRF